ncbi:MAG: phosphatidylserine decarboxylase [Deltaproteobacteria bacterium]|nr:phosphatidylserine decarboxylase [Deltaproteobacteria bacterium]
MDADKPADRGLRERAGSTSSSFAHSYSALVGWGATKTLPQRLRPFAYRAFARAVGANLDEAELSLDAYPSFGDFFARRLRNGARSIDRGQHSVISPCDGVVAAAGVAVGGALVQAKGRNYTLAELLASSELADRFIGGEYATIYLSPRDYHRVHAPVSGRLLSYDYIPGALWPVNPRVVGRREGVFARNERVVIHVNSPQLGDVGVVMVGAAGVGNITLHHGFGGGELSSRALRGAGERYRSELDVEVARGDELGAFRLGSTVILVFQPGRARLALAEHQALHFGEPIGQVVEGNA